MEAEAEVEVEVLVSGRPGGRAVRAVAVYQSRVYKRHL